MKRIAVIDSETDPFKKGRVPAPFLWGFYDGEQYKEFDKEIDLIAFLEDQPIIVYAHNGGKFDYHFLLDYIEPFTKVMIINGRISKFKINKCEFRDSYNILPTALSQFQKTQIDYRIFEKEERDKPDNKKLISSYLYDDCRFLYEYVTSFIDRFGLCLTQAGAAMQQWKVISQLDPPNDVGGVIYEKFKKYYYGGRCQSFEYGVINEDFVSVDINSAYPFAMLSKHPLYTDTVSITFKDWEALDKEAQGSCFITVFGIAKGCFPFRGDDKSLYFPEDNEPREYCITGWEFLAALETKSLKGKYVIIEIFLFTLRTSFKKYILHFYDERQKAKEQGNKALDIFCKLLMNSLYGKFGSNPEDYHNYMVAETNVLDHLGKAGDWTFSGEFGPWALLSKNLEDEEQRFYNVATAASITGFVRAFMWRALCSCEGVLYCDTDSIAARKVNNLPNGIGNELGMWKNEGEFSQGLFCGRKLYAMEYKSNDSTLAKKQFKMKSSEIRKERWKCYKIANKGVDLSPEQLYKIASGESVVYEPENPVFSIHKKPHFINRTVKMVKKSLFCNINLEP